MLNQDSNLITVKHKENNKFDIFIIYLYIFVKLPVYLLAFSVLSAFSLL